MNRTSLGLANAASATGTDRRRALAGFPVAARATLGRSFGVRMTATAPGGVDLAELLCCAPAPGNPLADRRTQIAPAGEQAFAFGISEAGRTGRVAFIARRTASGRGAVASNAVVATFQTKRTKGR